MNYQILKTDQSKLLLSKFKRKLPKREEYLERLVMELDLIIRKKLVSHLLQVIEILELTSDIPHIIRGSSGSCLICYGLGISPFDPIKENVSFARFLNETRDSLPDVDMDFPYNRREEVFTRIENKWKGQVARISNHLHFQEKSALREAFRIKGYRKLIPKEKLKENFIPEWTEEIKEIKDNLLGEFRGYSLHCGGIIIYPNGVPEELLLKNNNVKTKTENQVIDDKYAIDEKKLFKIDILSNRGLAQLLDISSKSLDDYPETLDSITQLFARGDNLGLTFAESPAMRKVLSIVQPKNIQQVALCLALIRPAAAEGRKNDVLFKASQGQSCSDIIFDDDAIQFIQNKIHCDEGQADEFRRAFAKKKYKKMEFFENILNTFGYQEKTKENITKNLNSLQKYSFCKSHALSYAKLVWALAYQKIKNPKKFWVSTLNHCHSSYRSWVHFNQAKSVGIELTLGKRPWKLENNQLISLNRKEEDSLTKNLQIKMKKRKNIKNLDLVSAEKTDKLFQLKNFGYWISKDFLDGMYLEVIPDKSSPNNLFVKFKGLIATGRVYKRQKVCTFITIGYDNNRFVDLTIDGKLNYYFYNFVEGEGYLRNYLDLYLLNRKQDSFVKKINNLDSNAFTVEVINYHLS